jgi:hypothetical protein
MSNARYGRRYNHMYSHKPNWNALALSMSEQQGYHGRTEDS